MNVNAIVWIGIVSILLGIAYNAAKFGPSWFTRYKARKAAAQAQQPAPQSAAAAPAAAVPPQPQPSRRRPKVPLDPTVTLLIPTEAEIKAQEDQLRLVKGIKEKQRLLDVEVLDEGDFGPATAPVIGLAIVAAIHLAICFVIHALMARWLPPLKGTFWLVNGIAGFATSAIIASWHSHFWRAVEGQKLDVMNDMTRGGMKALRAGFHWTQFWWKFDRQIDLVKHEKIEAKGECAHFFTTRDPLKCGLDWETLYRPIDSMEGIRNFLSYTDENRESRIAAVINSRISTIGGRNMFKAILINQGDFITWISLIFGGEGVLSEFEQELGVSIVNPAAKGLRLTDKSEQKIAEAQPRLNALVQAVKDLVAQGVDKDDAANAGLLILGNATQHTTRYEGLDHLVNLHTFAPGNERIAIGTGRGDNGRGQGKGPKRDQGQPKDQAQPAEAKP